MPFMSKTNYFLMKTEQTRITKKGLTMLDMLVDIAHVPGKKANRADILEKVIERELERRNLAIPE